MAGERAALALLEDAGHAQPVPGHLDTPRLQFGVLGVLQYVAPTIQFLLGITLFGEHVSISYWIGLVGVWIGSAIYLTMTIRDHEAPAVEEPC